MDLLYWHIAFVFLGLWAITLSQGDEEVLFCRLHHCLVAEVITTNETLDDTFCFYDKCYEVVTPIGFTPFDDFLQTPPNLPPFPLQFPPTNNPPTPSFGNPPAFPPFSPPPPGNPLPFPRESTPQVFPGNPPPFPPQSPPPFTQGNPLPFLPYSPPPFPLGVLGIPTPFPLFAPPPPVPGALGFTPTPTLQGDGSFLQSPVTGNFLPTQGNIYNEVGQYNGGYIQPAISSFSIQPFFDRNELISIFGGSGQSSVASPSTNIQAQQVGLFGGGQLSNIPQQTGRKILQRPSQQQCEPSVKELLACCPEYIVKEAEGICDIAERFFLECDEFSIFNGVVLGDGVQPGDVLQICLEGW